MRRVYLVQHAKAYSKEEDPERSLTPEGEFDISQVTGCFRDHHITIDHIYHSGKTRARQTAQLIADQISIDVEVKQMDGLEPIADPSIIGQYITASGETDLFVGHMPHVQKLASYLITGDEYDKLIGFQNAGIVCLEFDEKDWFVRWIITPELFPKKSEDDVMYA